MTAETNRDEAHRKLRLQAFEEIRRKLAGRFACVDLDSAEPLYLIPVGCSGWVCVIGHPEQGSYEWVGRCDAGFVEHAEATYEHSDCGYGDTAVAMRDGLTQMVS